MARIVQLTIPGACHEDWTLMTPEEKGRYCMACRKTVVDFSDMNDREIDQLNRTILCKRNIVCPG